MEPALGQGNEPRGKEKAWAVVRLVLGIAQVMGATVTLVFLAQTGPGSLTAVAAVVTLCGTCLSRLLFSRADRKD